MSREVDGLSKHLFGEFSVSADTSQRLDVTVHVTVLRMVCKDDPPVVGVGSDVDPVAVEAAVGVCGEGTARPHSHSVHVIPRILFPRLLDMWHTMDTFLFFHSRKFPLIY